MLTVPCLFNLFLEEILTNALDDFISSPKIGGRGICNLRFADNIDLIAENKEELDELTKRLDKAASNMGMTISTEKNKILVTREQTKQQEAENPENKIIRVQGTPLEEVQKFRYLRAIVTEDGRSEMM